jgi:hypothetical protein
MPAPGAYSVTMICSKLAAEVPLISPAISMTGFR